MYRRFVEEGFVVLQVNYRGVGRSEGLVSHHGAVVDAASVIAYAKFGLGFPEDRIITFGHSIGGAFGAQAASYFPGVLMISDRSFGTLSRAGCHLLCPPRLASKPLARHLFHLILRYGACFELDTVSYYQSLHADRKLIVCSEDDRIIRAPAQLASQMLEVGHSHADVGCILQMAPRGRPGEAHNCDFTPEEYRRLFAIVHRFLNKEPFPATI